MCKHPEIHVLSSVTAQLNKYTYILEIISEWGYLHNIRSSIILSSASGMTVSYK